ncbi:MAG: cellulase family glycosylhydrolase [Anaerolineae bacterium]|nr:cellulase family glycosylhydrolase [Anaerolineae bacterium]MDW8102223.1 cellulase family glycosylhydrolase [Anaerolineae bacterium]
MRWVKVLLYISLVCVAGCRGSMEAKNFTNFRPARYAVDYGAKPNLEHLSQAELAIVQPVLSPQEIRLLREGGTEVLAYISIGEAEPDDPALPNLSSCILGQNPNWGSWYMDARCSEWQDFVLERARSLREKGYSGLFLDTVDTAELYPQTSPGFVELIRRLRQEIGGIIVQNRGFSVLDEVVNYIDGIMHEDLSAGYDFSTGHYLYHEQDPTPALTYRDRLILLALDYAPPDRPHLAWKACERARLLGFTGYVAFHVYLHEGGIFCDEVPLPPSYRATPQGVLRGSEMINLYGLNWFGMETRDRAPHGLWTGRKVPEFLKQIRELGFTALRLPLSPQVLWPGYDTASWAQNPGGYPSDAYAGLLYFLEEARKEGLYVLLDFHTYDPNRLGASLPGRPFGNGYTKENWLADLRRMAEIALSFPNVMGIDLCNEPYALTWAEWKALAKEGAETILQANPFILAIVEGVGNMSDNGGWPAFWGENLTEAYEDPIIKEWHVFLPLVSRAGGSSGLPSRTVTPSLLGRILYLPHVYGPDVAHQPYFDDPDFPHNLPDIWEIHFGRMAGKFPLGIGEFGGRYEGKDKIWQDAFVDYLLAKKIHIFFYWALNPNSGDTGGLLLDDWRTVHEGKLTLLRRLMHK